MLAPVGGSPKTTQSTATSSPTATTSPTATSSTSSTLKSSKTTSPTTDAFRARGTGEEIPSTCLTSPLRSTGEEIPSTCSVGGVATFSLTSTDFSGL